MKEFFEPNLYLYDAYPGGIGFSEPLYRVHDLLLRRTRELIDGCPCEQGCPSCVGPAGEKSERTKEAGAGNSRTLVRVRQARFRRQASRLRVYCRARFARSAKRCGTRELIGEP